MKRLSVCIILFITILLFTACRIESNISDSANISESQESSSDLESVSETESTPVNEQIEKDETVSYETNDISSYDTNDISNTKLQNVEMTVDDGQLIDTTPIYFTEVLGTRKRYPNSLPNIIGFQYPYVFYERMTVVVEDADKNDAALYIGRYSIETKEAQEFAIESFTAISDEARLVVDEDRIVYMYCTLDEQGELKINIELYDYKNNTSKLLSTNYVYNVFGYAKKLNEKELVFFFYESVSSNTQQVILHYDLESEKLNEIYRGNNIVGYNDNSTSTKDIWAIDTNNGNIELLMQQLVDGKMVFYLCTLNNQGAVIQETKLDALAKYDSIEDTADSLVVKGNYLFIHYSQYNKSEKNSNAPFSILYKENNEYHLLKTEDNITPKNICGSKASDMPYVVYRSYESENELFVFNVDTGERFLLDMDGNEIGNLWVDQAGNLLVATRTEDKTNWYFYASDYISEKLIR